MVQNLFTPILDDGLRTINFFNGRLLSGEDLSDEQAANRDLMKRLGQVAGNGIAYGLQVQRAGNDVNTAANPAVTIRRGLAVNRLGRTLYLPADTDVALVRPAQGANRASSGAIFADCVPSQTGVYAANNGVYLLTMAPSSGALGRAPVSGLGNVNASCNTRYNVDGVQFRLLQLQISAADLSQPDLLRNRVAYRCFGPPDMLTNPFATPAETYGLLDALRPNVLTECDVPLALVYLARPQGLGFIDMWSVRRHITSPSIGERWNLLIGNRRASEAEAMFLQFQDQIDDIRRDETTLVESIVATTRFEHLPPVGILPAFGVQQIPDQLPRNPGRTSRGFDYRQFFQNHFQNKTMREPVFIEGAQLRSLILESFDYPPIDLNSHELIWLYAVRENRQAYNNSTTTRPQPTLVFANGQMPYRGNARYDVNRWDYSNFA